MEFGQLLAERDGLGKPLGEVVEVAQIKVHVGVSLECAPSNGLGAEVGRDRVDGRCGGEFTFQRFPAMMADGYLNRLSMSFTLHWGVTPA